MIVPEEFLGKENIITNVSSRNESSLCFVNNRGEDNFESVGKDFGDTLVNSITARDGSKVGHERRV